jgi:hypothetical protein
MNSLYQLKHGGLNSNWELMPQQLKAANQYIVAIIVPDIFAQNCTIT